MNSQILITMSREDLIETIKDTIKCLVTSNQKPPPEIIDQPELCKRLGISRQTANTWTKKRKIPCMQVGGSLRFNWPAVVEFLEKKSGK